MILYLRTDQPIAVIGLHDGTASVIEKSWEAHRRLALELPGAIEDLVAEHGAWAGITGIAVFKGPGSFTGLRIGATVANTIAYARALPIIGETGDDWLHKAVQQLVAGHDGSIVLPHYGADPHITQQKK